MRPTAHSRRLPSSETSASGHSAFEAHLLCASGPWAASESHRAEGTPAPLSLPHPDDKDEGTGGSPAPPPAKLRAAGVASSQRRQRPGAPISQPPFYLPPDPFCSCHFLPPKTETVGGGRKRAIRGANGFDKHLLSSVLGDNNDTTAICVVPAMHDLI